MVQLVVQGGTVSFGCRMRIKRHMNFVGSVDVEYRMMRQIPCSVGFLGGLFSSQLSCITLANVIIDDGSILSF